VSELRGSRLHWTRALLSLVLWSLAASALAQAANASHQAPVGASPLYWSLLPAYKQCSAPDQGHNPPLGFPSCSTASLTPPAPRSTQVIWGPSSIGFVRLVVCNLGAAAPFCNPPPPGGVNGAWAQPDVITGSIIDLRCTAAAPPCPTPGTSPYDPDTATSHYTTPGTGSTAPRPPCFPTAPNPPGGTNPTCGSGTADATLTATIPGDALGSAVRITDHGNPSNPGTVADSPFPVPLDCQPAAPAGSNCGVNTTVNALVAGAIVTGATADIEIGQITMIDLAGDPFAVQGIFSP